MTSKQPSGATSQLLNLEKRRSHSDRILSLPFRRDDGKQAVCDSPDYIQRQRKDLLRECISVGRYIDSRKKACCFPYGKSVVPHGTTDGAEQEGEPQDRGRATLRLRSFEG